jgi:hypothetical protein
MFGLFSLAKPHKGQAHGGYDDQGRADNDGFRQGHSGLFLIRLKNDSASIVISHLQ